MAGDPVTDKQREKRQVELKAIKEASHRLA
jgi:hypothetical protein